jgi:alkanesulfonate monooxygenase SsuD/methylene tetrahydromethanopterin reductase-like flavin-dependent oxidoreductase (luciferase family)
MTSTFLLPDVVEDGESSAAAIVTAQASGRQLDRLSPGGVPTCARNREEGMKLGLLQFFGWLDRSVQLSSIYDLALERIAIMDTAGYDAVWLAEHHFTSFSVCPSVHMMGVMAAARTKRLRIGTAVSLAPFYNPLRLAEEVALLDVLSGGRVNWGAGRGFEVGEFKAFGIPGEESAPRFHEAVDIVLEAWTNEKLSYQGKYFSYDGVEVLPKPLQTPHPPVWMAASSTNAIDWAASKGFSILMDPHSSRADLIRKRRRYAEQLAAAGHSDAGRVIPMARLVAIDDTAEKAREVARRGAQWMVSSYVGNTSNVRQEVRTFNDKNPVDYYLEDVVLHGTAESVAEQIAALGRDAGMNYLMAAPLSRRSFALLTDKVLPRIAT